MEEAAGLPEMPDDLSNNEEFQVLFKLHYPHVVRKVMVIVTEQSLAEDIAQEVFVKLYYTDKTAIDNLPAWLTKVAINTAHNHIRTEQRHQARKGKQKMAEREETGSIEDIYMKREELGEVQKTLMRLSDRDRELLIMKFSGYSYDEIAESKGLEKTSVGALLARAKSRFKKTYMEERTDKE